MCIRDRVGAVDLRVGPDGDAEDVALVGHVQHVDAAAVDVVGVADLPACEGPGGVLDDLALVGVACRGLLPPVSYTHLRAHETVLDLVCRLLLEKNTKGGLIIVGQTKIRSSQH